MLNYLNKIEQKVLVFTFHTAQSLPRFCSAARAVRFLAAQEQPRWRRAPFAVLATDAAAIVATVCQISSGSVANVAAAAAFAIAAVD